MSGDSTVSQKYRQVPSSPVRRSQRIRLLNDKSSHSDNEDSTSRTVLPTSNVCEEAEAVKSDTDSSAILGKKLPPISEEREDNEHFDDQKDNSPYQEKMDHLKSSDSDDITLQNVLEKESNGNKLPPISEEREDAENFDVLRDDYPNQEKIDHLNISEDKTVRNICEKTTVRSQENLKNFSNGNSHLKITVGDEKVSDFKTQSNCKDVSKSVNESNPVGEVIPVETSTHAERINHESLNTYNDASLVKSGADSLKTDSKKETKNIIIDPSINSKIDELLLNVSDASDSESDHEDNSFIYTMAEEGEEDTPSEGSNDIVEVGEEINTTESELSTDESYDRDSFIDDGDNCELLSGDEYDLSFDNSTKRKRVIELSCDSDDDIISIEKPEKKNVKRRKKSRIIRFEDSSDSDTANKENISNFEDAKVQSENSPLTKQVVRTESNVTEINSCVQDVNEASPLTDHKDETEVTCFKDTIDSENVSVNSQMIENSSTEELPSRSEKTKVVIIENVRVQDICDKNISDQITSVINSMFTGVKSSSEVSINLSLDCSSESIDKQNSTFAQSNEIGELDKTVRTNKNQQTQTEGANEVRQGNVTRKRRKKNKKKKKKFDNIFGSLQETSREENNVTKLDNVSQPFEENNKKDIDIKIESKMQNGTKETVLSKNKYLKSIRKRRKKKKSKLSKCTAESVLNLTLLEEVVQSNNEKTLFSVETDNALNSKWKIKKYSVKPSKTSVVQPKVKDASLESNKIDDYKNKFHAKDFRNLMLYDDNRVKRMKTNLLLKKKL